MLTGLTQNAPNVLEIGLASRLYGRRRYASLGGVLRKDLVEMDLLHLALHF
jgi:hypothetical protein